MKKAYETPVAEKLEFDYTKVVASSGLNLFGTSDQQWCHTGDVKPTEGISVKCVETKPTEGIVVKCVS